MEIVKYTEFRSNFAYWFDKVVFTKKGIIIKPKSDNELVLMLLDEYNSLKESVLIKQ